MSVSFFTKSIFTVEFEPLENHEIITCRINENKANLLFIILVNKLGIFKDLRHNVTIHYEIRNFVDPEAAVGKAATTLEKNTFH